MATRLAQCLNPTLPSGVHQKALEVYAHIFAIIDVRMTLVRDEAKPLTQFIEAYVCKRSPHLLPRAVTRPIVRITFSAASLPFFGWDAHLWARLEFVTTCAEGPHTLYTSGLRRRNE